MGNSFSKEAKSPEDRSASAAIDDFGGDDGDDCDHACCANRRLRDRSSSPSKKSVCRFSDPSKRPASSPNLDVAQAASQNPKKRKIRPSTLNFGFIGLGIVGGGIVKNLLKYDHAVTVFNRSPEKEEALSTLGAKKALTPRDVMADADVTFSCVSDPTAARDVVFGECGVLSEVDETKSFVEMSGIDADTSEVIAEAVLRRRGRYLEAQLLQGGKNESEDEGSLVIICAGDPTLYNDCLSCFEAVGKKCLYISSKVGVASKMRISLQLMADVALAGLAEGLALADKAGLKREKVIEMLQLTGLNCPLLLQKGKAIVEGNFSARQRVKCVQKDLQLALSLGDQLRQQLPLSAAANEVFKDTKKLGHGEQDSSAVYLKVRF